MRTSLALALSLVGLAALPSVALAGHTCAPGGPAPNLVGAHLSSAEHRALRLVSVCITDSRFGAIVDATFAGNVGKLIGKGGLTATAIGLVFEPKTAGAAPIVVATRGSGAHPVDVRSKVLTDPGPIVRHGPTITFFVDYPHVDQLKQFAVVLVVRRSSRGKKASQAAPSRGGLTPADRRPFLELSLGVGFREGHYYPVPTLVDDCGELKALIDRANADLTALPSDLVGDQRARLEGWLRLAEAEYTARPCPPKTTTPPPQCPAGQTGTPPNCQPATPAKSCTASTSSYSPSPNDIAFKLSCNFAITALNLMPPSGKQVTNVAPVSCNNGTCSPAEMCTYTAAMETCTGNQAANVEIEGRTEFTPSPAHGDTVTGTATPADGSANVGFTATIP